MNWTDPNTRVLINEHKGRQREDQLDRLAMYRDYRRRLPHQYYVCDVDHLEYRVKNDMIIPVALLELTRYDYDNEPHYNYLKAIEKRFNKRDFQGSVARFIARKLNCKAWIVLFSYKIDIFWLYDLSMGDGWWRLEQAEYTKWLEDNCLGLGYKNAIRR